MLNYRYTAFSYRGTINGKAVSGNPSSIFLLDNEEEISRKTMSELGVIENYPMTCFVRQRTGLAASYDIFHYNLDGSQAYMCGSATMAAACILNELFGIDRVNFYFDTAPFTIKPASNLIVASVESDGRVFLEQDIDDFNHINDKDADIEFIAMCLHLENSSLLEVIRAEKLNDLIFIVDSSISVRKMRPDFRALVSILDKLNVRNLCITARSCERLFDFETRIFVPHDNLDEDLACGSSALPIASYWKRKINKSSFSVLFPYHMDYENGTIGGVQFIDLLGSRARVGGYCEAVAGSDVSTDSRLLAGNGL
ncbi:MAG: PhzF family phenazine biosynthesis protein [Rickettsiales bacterium]|jgi:predicted PhzF superfamily epimerase YddE/YHI9|nr:PhzF family phenazine biosynthesis protein [Rickettsiales bacterium]